MKDVIDNFDGPYRWLSNFWVCPVTDSAGRTWSSVEAAYQAHKSDDYEIQCQFLPLTPGAAKHQGQVVRLRSGWDDIRLDIMKKLVRAKFTQNQNLMRKLIATGDQELIEGNWWGDTYWGTCLGKGENHLGKILMEIREEHKDDIIPR